LSARRNVVIRNGTVRDFGSHGVNQYHANGKNNSIINVQALSNGGCGIRISGAEGLVKDCVAAENGEGGFFLTRCLVTGNSASSNSGDGFYAESSSILGNSASYNDGFGIVANGGCTVQGNTTSTNPGGGIWATGSVVTGNASYNNGGDGIQVSSSCMVLNNACTLNGFYSGDAAGIHVTFSHNRVEANTLTYNDRGLQVDADGNLIIKNSTSGNTTDYDIFSGNAVGDILNLSPGGTITSSNPWANFRF
jgi:parallel beta-helix repeat protein